MSNRSNETLSARLMPAMADMQVLRGLFLALAGSAILATAAKLQVPFYPVPITMTTYVVLVMGAAFGPRLAAATFLVYYFEGFVLGLPVFAGPSAGLAYLASPTIGYLLAYLPAAVAVGMLAERGFDRRPASALAMMALGAAIILIVGASWLALMIGAGKAWSFGVLPFLLGDALKTALAAATLPLAWTILGR